MSIGKSKHTVKSKVKSTSILVPNSSAKKDSVIFLFKNIVKISKLNVKDIELLDGIDINEIKKKFDIKGLNAKTLQCMIKDFENGIISLPGVSHKSKYEDKVLNKDRIIKILADYETVKRNREIPNIQKNIEELKKNFNLSLSQSVKGDVPIKNGPNKSEPKDLHNKHNIFSKFVYNIDKIEVNKSNNATKSRPEKPTSAKKKTEPKNRTEKPSRNYQEKQENDQKKSRTRSHSESSSNKDKHSKDNYGSSAKHSNLISNFKIKRNNEKVDLTETEKKPIMSRLVKVIDVNRHRNKVEPIVEDRPIMSRLVKAMEIKRHHDNIEPKQTEERPIMSRIVKAIEIKRHPDKSEEKLKPTTDRPMIYRIVNRAMDIKPSFIFHDKVEKELNDSEKNPSKNSLEFHLSSKIWQVLSHDLFNKENKETNNDEIDGEKLKTTDSVMKNHILSVIKKYNKKELKHGGQIRQETQTEDIPPSSSTRSGSGRRKMLKRRVRRQLWQWAKTAIRNSEHWSKIFAENHVMLDNINIDKLDLSLIDIDALGIENKMLKKSIIWLFK